MKMSGQSSTQIHFLAWLRVSPSVHVALHPHATRNPSPYLITAHIVLQLIFRVPIAVPAQGSAHHSSHVFVSLRDWALSMGVTEPCLCIMPLTPNRCLDFSTRTGSGSALTPMMHKPPLSPLGAAGSISCLGVVLGGSLAPVLPSLAPVLPSFVRLARRGSSFS